MSGCAICEWRGARNKGGRPFGQYYDSATDFIHQNHLGSKTMLTDHTGAVIQDTIYYPWGQAWSQIGSNWDNRFASMQWRNFKTEMDPTQFRMYQWRLYRWMSPDPVAGDILNPQSLNRYAYVGNNPTTFIDPLGLDPCANSPDPVGCRRRVAGMPPPPTTSTQLLGWGIATNPQRFGAWGMNNWPSDCRLDGFPIACWLAFDMVRRGVAYFGRPVGGRWKPARGYPEGCYFDLTKAGTDQPVCSFMTINPRDTSVPDLGTQWSAGKLPSKTKQLGNCVASTLRQTLPQTVAQFGQNLKWSVAVGVPLGLAIGGGLLAAEPELAPAAPLLLAVTTGQTVSTLAHISFNIFVIGGVTDLVAAPAFCAANVFGD